jgi:RecT family.
MSDTGTQVQTVEDGMTAVAMLSDDKQMDRFIRFAEIMATGKATIPSELRNVGDCMAITMQAMNWKMNPFSVAQKTFFINGRIGYEAQLVAAAINNSGAIVGNFDFEWFGPWEKIVGKFDIKKNDKGQEYRVPGWRLADEEGVGIKVWAMRRGESDPRVMQVLLAQARTRNSTMWADDPKQQLAYLAQKKWARLYAPGVILGVYTPDELQPELTVIDHATGEVINNKKKPELEGLSAEKFEQNKAAWKMIVESGKKTANAMIATLSTKAVLTDEQKMEIASWEAIEEGAEHADS